MPYKIGTYVYIKKINSIKQYQNDLDFQRGFHGFEKHFWLCIGKLYSTYISFICAENPKIR